MKSCDGKVYRIVKKTVWRRPGWRRQGGRQNARNDVGGEGVREGVGDQSGLTQAAEG